MPWFNHPVRGTSLRPPTWVEKNSTSDTVVADSWDLRLCASLYCTEVWRANTQEVKQSEASTETVILTTQSLCLQLLRLMRREEGGGGSVLVRRHGNL